VFGLNTVGRELRGAVTYAETDFADSIFQLVRGKFLNATSTSWQPIEWDRMSSGGCLFTDVDLLEISQVNIPALPTALAEAGPRGLRGINLRPLRQWAENALDGGRYVRNGLPREEVEALYRAINEEIPGVELRRRKAEEILARVQREDAAAANARLAHHDAVRCGESW
jgi:hypothetical protein